MQPVQPKKQKRSGRFLPVTTTTTNREPDNGTKIKFPYDNPHWIIHLFFIFLVAGCVGFFYWAWYFELDVFSIASGEVIPSGQIKKVQHLEGGIVKEILVREGDLVNKGQPMIILAKTATGADVEELGARLIGLRVEMARLKAIAENRNHPVFPDDIKAKHPDLVRQAVKLFTSEQQNYFNDIKIQKNLLTQRETDLKQIQVRLQNSKNNLQFIEQQVKISEDLLKEDLTDRYTHLNLLREQSTLQGLIKEDSVALEKMKAGIKEAKSVLNGLTHAYKGKARQELEKKRQEFSELSRRMTKYSDQLQRTSMLAPVDGIIKTLHVYAKGEVVKPGNTVAEIVPEGVSLIVEALLAPGDIGYVTLNQKALIMLASADASRFKKLKGQVIQISPDTFTAENGFSYYKVRIKPESEFFQGRHVRYALKAGVQVNTNIIVGKRSVLAYFIEPFLGSFSTSLSEI
jgi:adhesin transport system membrane fusion protein